MSSPLLRRSLFGQGNEDPINQNLREGIKGTFDTTKPVIFEHKGQRETVNVPKDATDEDIAAIYAKRYQNIRTPVREITPSVEREEITSPERAEEDIVSKVNRLYSPDTRATDQFMELMKQIPERPEPSTGRRILGGLASLGPRGRAAGEEVLYGDYGRQLSDFKVRADLLKDLASSERAGNVNERALLGSILSNEAAGKRLAESERAARERADITRSRDEATAESRKLRDELAKSQADKTLSDAEKLRLKAEYDAKLEELKQKGKVELADKKKQQSTNLEAIREKTRETLGQLDEILGSDNKLKSEIRENIGTSRMFGRQFLPGDLGTRAGEAKIKRLKALLIVDLIGEMKAQSRTGATGFGQLNLRELATLEGAASKLDPLMSEEEFEAELQRIREKLNKVLAKGTDETSSSEAGKPSAADLIKKYGGG